MIVIGVDPSGEFDKGKGTTGIAAVKLNENDQPSIIVHGVVSASDYKTRMSYWEAVLDAVESLAKAYHVEHIVIEDYILYANAAKAQINSGMETSKLIGMLMYYLGYGHKKNYKVYLNMAANVMNRWNNAVLEHEGVIDIEGRRVKNKDGYINPHALDAIRHAVHGLFFLVRKENYIR